MSPPHTLVFLLLLLAFGPMLFEARLAARHDRALRAAGAVEPHDDVFRWMQVVYPAAFTAMAAEAYVRPHGLDALVLAGLGVFALAKGLKYWAIAMLGPRWTFRVLVPPRAALVTSGPYRFMRHPNYLGVMGELAGFALIAHAAYAGPASMVMFAWLIARRIGVEERALHIHRGTHGDHAHRAP
jgi:methyltransferase